MNKEKLKILMAVIDLLDIEDRKKLSAVPEDVVDCDILS